MRIVREYSEDNYRADLLEITSATYLGNFVISIVFSDGFKRSFDFKPFLESSQHPSIRKYLDESQFKEFTIIDGNLNWNDYDLIFPIEDLHAGRI